MIVAVIDSETNIIVNRIVADVTDPAHDGHYFVEIPEGVHANIGWSYNGTEFVNPNPTIDNSNTE